jgi:hypothetical protein
MGEEGAASLMTQYGDWSCKNRRRPRTCVEILFFNNVFRATGHV